VSGAPWFATSSVALSVPVPGTAASSSTSAVTISSLPSDIVAFVVFCRLRYTLTLRDLSEIMLLRGFTGD